MLSGFLGIESRDTNGALVTAATDVGTYPIHVVGAQTAANYSIQYVNGSLTVTQAVLTVDANPAVRAYGATNPTFGAAISGYVNSQNISAIGGTLAVSSSANRQLQRLCQ